MGLEEQPKLGRMVLSYKGQSGDPTTSSGRSGEMHKSVFLLHVYMEALPDWLQPANSEGSNNWMDLDNKMTQTIALARFMGEKYSLVPGKQEDVEKCETIEKELFQVMIKMGYTINKVCYDPNSGADSFDLSYAQSRFAPRCNSKLPLIEKALDSPFLTGEDLVYTDFLLYAVLHDLKAFVPKCFEGQKHPKIATFLEKFEGHPSLKEWFSGDDGKEYVRPPHPDIHFLMEQQM